MLSMGGNGSSVDSKIYTTHNRKASNALRAPKSRDKKSFPSTPEAVKGKYRITKTVWWRVPGHPASYGERRTTKEWCDVVLTSIVLWVVTLY